ncbi:uncharacterized protein DS421_14g465900 [Arachis hypogaea]|nr:uncharacterized protein DS421_14g465900 [Arachis hypogaea]
MEKTGRESASEEEGGAALPPHSVTPSRVLLAVEATPIVAAQSSFCLPPSPSCH